jgi:hypothetical protein
VDFNRYADIGGDEVLKKKAMLGLTIALVGAALLLYGIYYALTAEYVEANIPNIVANNFVPVTIGLVVIINGVVVQGFRNYYALMIHLIANAPYALAIIGINNLAQQINPPTNPQDYLMTNFIYIYWIIGAIFNIGGIIANRFANK